MIKWKKRLYAFFLKQAVGPLLDLPSRRKLHESIDVTFQEGTFSFCNIGLCTSYLNQNVENRGLLIKKARIESVTIHLSLKEGQASGSRDQSEKSSLAWRAMKLGTTVALVAHVEINGIELELQPLPKEWRKSGYSTTYQGEHADYESQSKSMISSYVDAAFASLRLTFNITNLSAKLCHQSVASTTTSWVDFRLHSVSYQDLDVSSLGNPASFVSKEEGTTSRVIFEKAMLFQGICVSAGETESTIGSDGVPIDFSTLVSTIAMAEGTGQVSIRAAEFRVIQNKNASQTQQDGEKKPVQQDLEVRINQQVKVSVSETSLVQIQAVAEGFAANQQTCVDESGSQTLQESASTREKTSPSNKGEGEKVDLYTINGIMKQYQEARQLAERNEIRGGILVPTSAFEEGDHVGGEDPRTFDVFFDANDKSFNNYASMMKDSVMASPEGSLYCDFVHTQLRLHLLGGGIKLSFGSRKSEARLPLGSEEYALLTFNDLEVISRLSGKRTEVSFQVTHLEIDDAQIPRPDVDTTMGRMAEIGNLMCFRHHLDDMAGDGDLLIQPACISTHFIVERDAENKKKLDLELHLEGVELTYRARTLSQLSALAAKLRGEEPTGVSANSSNHPKENKQNILQSSLFTISSLTLTLPLTEEKHALSQLFARHGHKVDTCNSNKSALGLIFDQLSFEHNHCHGMTADGLEAATTSTLDIHSFLFFISSRAYTNGHSRGRNVCDFFSATGRFEVDPFIPITFVYKCNLKGNPEGNVARKAFPSVPAFSSFKARQEDDEGEEINRLLSEKLSNVSVDSRRALRAKDPQNEMLLESEKSESVILVHIPEILLDLSKEELEVLIEIIGCSLPVPTNGESATATCWSPSSAVALSFVIDSASFCALSIEKTKWNSHFVRLDKCRAYTIMGGPSRWFCRFLAHEVAFFEIIDLNLEAGAGTNTSVQTAKARAAILKKRTAEQHSAAAVPILYRSKLFPAISHTSPSLLLDFIRSTNTGSSDHSEQSVFLSLYHMTYRYNPDSRWLDRLEAFFDLETISNKGDRAEMRGPEIRDEKSSLKRVFLSFADCNFDYTSLNYFKTESRSILRVGDLRFSSNVVKPAGSVQAYSVSMGDFSWCLCNTRALHNFENSLLPGASRIMAPENLVFRPYQASGGFSASQSETVVRDMCSKTVLTLESIDALIVKKAARESKPPSQDPSLTVSVTAGELSLYVCKDSFQCFTGTVAELQARMTAVTNEEIDKLASKMKAENGGLPLDEHDQCTAVKAAQQDSRVNVVALPVDTDDDFLLDGYDWMTINTCRGAEIPPGEEQTSCWFHASPVIDDRCDKRVFRPGTETLRIDSNTMPSAPQINSQHFPLHVASDPLSDGDMEASKLAGCEMVMVKTRVLLHEMKVKVRFFDGYDWPEYQRKQKTDPRTLFEISEPIHGKGEHEKNMGDNYNGGKSAQLGGLLAAGDDNVATFGNLPLPEEQVRYTFAKNEIRRLSRRTSSYIQVSAQGVSLRVDSYLGSPQHRLSSCVRVNLRDFFLAETISSLQPVKMFGEWFNEVEHPRDSRDGLLMLKVVMWHPPSPLTPEKQLASNDCEVALTMAPMRCILDQRAIKFAKVFFDSKDQDQWQDWTTDQNLMPAPSVRILRVKPVKLKIDYTPQEIDTVALKNGSIVELINLSPLDAMVLTLHEVEIENVADIGEALGSLIHQWLVHVKETQLYKFLTNSRPLEPLTTIGGGLTDLFVLPLDAYNHGGSLTQAVRNSVSSLVGNVAHETLTTSSRLASFIAKAAVGSQSPTCTHNSLPSRPLATPRHVGDTASHALESLSRGVQTANHKVIIVPYHEYRRSGISGAVKSIANGIPVAIAGPVGGASEALSFTLLGVRNQIRPDLRKEEEVSQRGLHYDGF